MTDPGSQSQPRKSLETVKVVRHEPSSASALRSAAKQSAGTPPAAAATASRGSLRAAAPALSPASDLPWLTSLPPLTPVLQKHVELGDAGPKTGGEEHTSWAAADEEDSVTAREGRAARVLTGLGLPERPSSLGCWPFFGKMTSTAAATAASPSAAPRSGHSSPQRRAVSAAVHTAAAVPDSPEPQAHSRPSWLTSSMCSAPAATARSSGAAVVASSHPSAADAAAADSDGSSWRSSGAAAAQEEQRVGDGLQEEQAAAASVTAAAAWPPAPPPAATAAAATAGAYTIQDLIAKYLPHTATAAVTASAATPSSSSLLPRRPQPGAPLPDVLPTICWPAELVAGTRHLQATAAALYDDTTASGCCDQPTEERSDGCHGDDDARQPRDADAPAAGAGELTRASWMTDAAFDTAAGISTAAGSVSSLPSASNGSKLLLLHGSHSQLAVVDAAAAAAARLSIDSSSPGASGSSQLVRALLGRLQQAEAALASHKAQSAAAAEGLTARVTVLEGRVKFLEVRLAEATEALEAASDAMQQQQQRHPSPLLALATVPKPAALPAPAPVLQLELPMSTAASTSAGAQVLLAPGNDMAAPSILPLSSAAPQQQCRQQPACDGRPVSSFALPPKPLVAHSAPSGMVAASSVSITAAPAATAAAGTVSSGSTAQLVSSLSDRFSAAQRFLRDAASASALHCQ